ncbi:MAG: hypothetical protein V3V05_06030 [Pontiella sp.]
MHYTKGIILLTATLGVIASGQAEEGDKFSESKSKDFSLRVSVGSAPGIDEGEVLGMTFPVDADNGSQIEFLAVKRFWSKNHPAIGGVFGGGIFIANNSGVDADPSSSAKFDLSAFGIMGQGGLAVKLGKHIVVEASPYLGLGGASVEITNFTDGGAVYVMYGLKGGIFVLLGQSIELGIEGSIHGFSSDVELELSPGLTTDLTLTGSGPSVAAVLAVKF